MDGGAYMSEAGSDATHHHVRLRARRTGQQSGLPEREGQVTSYSYRGIDGRWAHESPEKPAEGHASLCPFDKNAHRLGPGASP